MEDKAHNSPALLTKAAYTVVTPNYLAHALSLKKSFLHHNTDADFFICLLGKKEHIPEINFDNIYFLNSLSDSRIEGMTRRYTPLEMVCALKPFYAGHILEHQSNIQWLIYLDCDMYVFAPFTTLTAAAITLSPHRTKNTEYLPESKNYSVISLNRYGVYNAGYFELQRKPEAFAFLEWWKKLMEHSGYEKPDEHLFSDQLWLNLVHSFFDDVYVNKHPGYNVAIWNLIEREVEVKDGAYYVNKEPLVLYHFSKYNIEKPESMVNYIEPYLTFTNFPVLKNIYQKYREGLLEAGYEKYKTIPYPYAYTPVNKKKTWWKKLFS
jgi:hypothetical protein